MPAIRRTSPEVNTMTGDNQQRASETLPKGCERVGDRIRARKFVDGKRKQATFDTVDEAVAWQTGTPTRPAPGETAVTEGLEALNIPTDERLPAGVSRRGNLFRARAHHDGRNYEKLFDTVEEAVSWRKAAKRALRAGLPVPSTDRLDAQSVDRPAVTLVGEAVEAWHAEYVLEERSHKRLIPRTVTLHRSTIENQILPILGHLRLEEVTRDHIRAFRSYWAGFAADGSVRLDDDGEPVTGYDTGTMKRALWMLSATFTFAKSNGWTDKNPVVGVKAIKPQHPKRDQHTPVYVEWQTAYSLSSLLHEAYRLGFWLQRLCGLRIGEAWGLTIDDVDLNNRVLSVNKMGGGTYSSWDDDGEGAVVTTTINRTKTPSSTRRVGIPMILVPLIEDYLAQFRSDEPGDAPLLVNPNRGRTSSTYTAALGREGKTLGVWTVEDDPLVPHDLRKSFSTDLELLGVKPFLRSMILGHKPLGSIEGGAAITSSHYTLNTPYIAKIVEAADTLNDAIVEALESETVIVEDTFLTEWMRIEEAGVLLGVGPDTIKHYAKNGELPFKKHQHPNQNTPALWVSRAAVHELVEDKASRITVAQAANDLGLTDVQVLRLANSAQIPVNRQRVKMDRAYFDQDGWKRLKEVAGIRQDFLDRTMTLSAAAAALEVKTQTARGLIDRGFLDEVHPPMPGMVREGGHRPTRWVTVESVEKAKATPERWRRGPASRRLYGVSDAQTDPEYMTVGEAGVLLGRSGDWVRRLAKDGTFTTVQGSKGKRVLLTRESVEAYAKANRVEVRKASRRARPGSPRR